MLIRVHLWEALLRQKLLRVLWLLWEDKQEGRVGMAGMPYPPTMCLWEALLRQKLLRVLGRPWEDKQEGRVGMAGMPYPPKYQQKL